MEVNYRISGATEGLMKGVAYAAYGTNFLINIVGGWFGIGEIASTVFMFFTYCAYVLWFALKGVYVFSPKTLGKFIVSFILNEIPIVNVLYFTQSKNGLPQPGIVAMVARVVDQSREEDKQKGTDSAEKNGSGINGRARRASPEENVDNAMSQAKGARHIRPSFREGSRSTER